MSIDIFGLPDTTDNFQVFYTNGSTNSWQMWTKPRNCKFVSFFVIGGGAGGGGGQSTVSTARTGGGGGGGSSSVRAIFPANLIPDILYIQVGVGGAGGTAAGNGTAGSLSYVSITISPVSLFLITQLACLPVASLDTGTLGALTFDASTKISF